MAPLHTFPSGREICEAVREWLVDEVMPATEGTLSFHARVAANLLAVLERELEEDGTAEERYSQVVADLGAADEADLAVMIRRGDLIVDDTLLRVLGDATTARLRVSNPRHLVDVADDDPRSATPVE